MSERLSGKHPGRTKAQRKVLDQIGSGECCPRAHPKTIDRLLKEGLIEHIGTSVLGRDAFGKIEMPVYEMPTPIHMQWCQYWADQPADDEP
jgi:hypothetical protein